MRRSARLAVVLPAAAALALAAPALRALPGGLLLPDPLFLLLLALVPVRGQRLQRAAGWVGLLGLLRSALSASSPFVGWAGYGLGLAARRGAALVLAEDRLPTRFLIGLAAAAPLALLEAAEAARILLPLPATVVAGRVLLVGLAVALAGARPVPRREAAA